MKWVKSADEKAKRSDPIPGGVGAGLGPDDVDPNELQMGIKVEMEHVKNNREFEPSQMHDVAQDIALDHLAEDGPGFKYYYTWLKWMEEQMREREKPDPAWK